MPPHLNTINLPLELGMLREFRRTLSDVRMHNYKEGKLGAYDTRTIFYDVFLQADKKTVIAIGPPPLNLEKLVLSARLNIRGFSLPFKNHTNFKKLLILKAVLPFAIEQNDQLDAEMVFENSFRQPIVLAINSRLQGKALVTVQKNNKLHWIKDWATYYRGEYGIEHIYIYDNNSDGQEKLIEQLDGYAKVIPWNFPYGIVSSSGNQFCQVGALNHFKHRHAGNARIFNFDIDELLVCKSAKIKKRIASGELMRFNNYNVFSHDVSVPEPSFSNFVLRMAGSRNNAYKYVVSGDVPGILNVHYFQRNVGVLRKVLPEFFVSGPVIPVEEAYFLHYMGISTNWNNNRGFANKEELKSAVEDLSVVKAFEKIRI